MKIAHILIPAYKSDAFITDCLRSVNHQRVPEGWTTRVFVAVDACIDTARELHRNKTPYYWTTRNVGPYVIRNTLIGLHPADVYMYFDSDDVMCPGYVTESLRAIEAGANIAMVQKINCNGQLVRGKACHEHGGAMTFTRDVWIALGGFYASRCAADSDFLDRAVMAGYKITRVNKPLYMRRRHAEALTTNRTTGMGSNYRKKMWAEMTANRNAGNIHVPPVTCEFTPPPAVFPVKRERVVVRRTLI